jgi:molybdopterin adenylyltransferase
VRASVVTVSDGVASGEREDLSGVRAAEILESLGFAAERRIVSDGADAVESVLREVLDGDAPDLIITTGGTGLGPRDLTPEGTRRVLEREAPGITEAMRRAGGENHHVMLSRAVAGSVGQTLVVNLPGSVRGVEESLDVIGPALRHAVELLSGAPTEH